MHADTVTTDPSATPARLDRARAVDAELRAARATHRRCTWELARWLKAMDDEGLHEALGHRTVVDYAQVVLELAPRKTRDLLRLARAVPGFPAVEAAMARGDLDWTKARELLRVVTPETDAAWVEHAIPATSRELEAAVATARIGELPGQAPERPREPARRRVVVEMEAVEAEVLFQALAALRAETGLDRDEFDDGVALAALAKRYLEDRQREAPDEAPNAEPYRVVLEHCPACARTVGVEAEISDTIEAEACCDAEIVDLSAPRHRGHLTRKVPPSRRRVVLHRDRYACAVPGCRCKLWLDLHHLCAFARGGDHDEANLATVCPFHHRLLHEGRLALARRADGALVVEHEDGRRLVGPPHVGRPSAGAAPEARVPG